MHAFDIGIILGSACDEVWEAEMRRHPGFEAMLVLGDCRAPDCAFGPGTTRLHVQSLLEEEDPETAMDLAVFLQPHNGKDRRAILKLISEFSEQSAPREFDGTLGSMPELKALFQRLGR